MNTPRYLLLTLLVVSVCLVSCKKEESSAPGADTGNTAAQLEDFDILIDWLAEPTYLGVYYAKHLGLFEDLGLNVRIEQGRGANQAAAAVASGRYRIATASGGATVLARNSDMQVVSLGVLYPEISTVVYGLASAGIEKPEDLVGKKIGIYPGSITKNEFEAFVAANGLSMSDFTVVSLTGPDIPILKSGQVDGVLNYAEMSPAALRLDADVELVDGDRTYEIPLAEHGVTTYGLNIITSRSALEKDPERLQSIAAAIFEGYRRACAEPDKAVQAYLSEFPDVDPAYARESFDRVCSLIRGNYGEQTAEGWQKTIDLFDQLDLLEVNVKPADVMP